MASTPLGQNWQMGICRVYEGESRPVPVMGATSSKNQTESDGLVSNKAEQSSDSN
ncbi:hypothetical protein WKK05_23405 [Nostoc sp. UHCC 0302]|uniref:hypothetical protein n=1 Tax=Nostoc sp. UHCC 0302 TaxID=3134896 RepID=UPI00311CBDFD